MNSSDLQHRAVVTGYGCVTALGGDAPSTWRALIAGRCARAPLTAIEVQGCRVTEGAQAALPELSGFSPKQISHLSRASRLVLPAVEEALAMAGLLDGEGCSLVKRLETAVSSK